MEMVDFISFFFIIFGNIQEELGINNEIKNYVSFLLKMTIYFRNSFCLKNK